MQLAPLNCTVLIVDTDIKVVHGFAQSLRLAGYTVFEATSFEDGKRLWREIMPDVLIVDIRLGQYNGLQLLMRARSDQPLVKAIITCPFADQVLEAEARRFGGNFMVKPISPSQIVGAVESAASTAKAIPDTPPILLERRRTDRRKKNEPITWVERRVNDRRVATPLPEADGRAGDPRKDLITNHSPEPRPGDRRLTRQ